MTYRIKTEAARQLFAVNRLTGAISVLQAVDFEELAAGNSTYTFEVEALDHGGVLPPGTATVIVRITVRPLRGYAHRFKTLCFITAVSAAAWGTLKVQQVPVEDGLNLGGWKQIFIRSSGGDWIRTFKARPYCLHANALRRSFVDSVPVMPTKDLISEFN